ncbi:cobalt-precorrin-5B (C(1))-methyltransferase [Aromatoleum bremense]|uniref:Cobalt-precorrin-5B C(1)-methyltransferase n=1 Tax=Aromatoleum bremense TaxID=76115 RepID=A0ABX1NVH0_9RHOO|nr:cobalt-precorrin-5B (C(1))-methyltransferase [Aromatoleum bremense]NMG16011.1 cobalt-precorrin-5B (C(1))-methyltransferase [Aromatoleum bremense]
MNAAEKVRKGAPVRRRGNRTGFTTGACSAAAARAATLGLVSGRVPDHVDCRLPNGQLVRFAVADGAVDADSAHAVVVKDAGDDPDATNGAHLTADVRRLQGEAGRVKLCGGPGVGTVTQEGLGLEVGGPAINPVPRANIADNVRAAAGDLLDRDGLEVTISVPGGEAMAKKTLNARLGILGGISILGTTGIVKPYSTAAFRASVVQGVQVGAAQRQPAVVFTTGGRTEKCAMREHPELAQACFVQMGDFVKAAFDAAQKYGFRRVILGAMVGKLTKVAQGLAVTHAWRKAIDRDLLAGAASEIGAPPVLVEEIRAAETGRFAAEKLAALGLAVPFHRALAQRAWASLNARYPGAFELDILVCDFEGRPIVTLRHAEAVGASQGESS